MTDLWHPDDRYCGSCRHWVHTSGEYSASKRTCANNKCEWYRIPKDYSDGVQCGFWEASDG